MANKHRSICTVPDCARLTAAHGLCGMHYMRVKSRGTTSDPDAPEIRFWRRVDVRGPDECWPWKGWTNQNGHGQFHLHGRVRIYAHVYSWILKNGRLPADRPHGCHRCDNPPCCNPAHIFPGNPQINAADRHAKGRDAKGARHGMTKSSEATLLVLRARIATGDKYADIARDFGIATVTVASIKTGRRRAHVRSIP